MDDTPLNDLISDLAAADPAEAPGLAEAVAADLSAKLEALQHDPGDEGTRPSEQEEDPPAPPS